MNNESLLAGLSLGECVDPHGDVRLLVELACVSADVCRHLQRDLASLDCQMAWQEAADECLAFVLVDRGEDLDRLLRAVAQFLDHHPGQARVVETRLVQDRQDTAVRHGFSFVSSLPAGQRRIFLAADNHAFGSGSHPSTGLVVELLEELADFPSPVLDVGCGSGVLSFVAARLGARQVTGVDIDSRALVAAVENARANDLSDQVSFSSSPLDQVPGCFALILANLTGSVLFRLLAALSSKAGPGCRLIVSGLQGRQAGEAVSLAAAYGWRLEKSRSCGKWQARLLVRS